MLKGRFSRSFSFTLLGLLATLAPQLQAQVLNWISKADLPQTAHVHGGRSFGVAALNGKIFTVGGLNQGLPPPGAIATVLEYSPTPDSWTQRANLSTPRYAPAAAAVNGKIYAVGGFGQGGVLATAEEYDPVANSWKATASMNQRRYAHQAVALNGKIYALGGQTVGDVPLASLEEYDPALNAWAIKAPMPTARVSFGAVAFNGKIYVVGGRIINTTIAPVYSYDPASDSWATNASIPTLREVLAAVAVNGKVLAIGGQPLGGNAIEEYDPARDSWTNKPNLPTSRSECFAAVIDNTLFVFGGYDLWTMHAVALSPEFCSPHKAAATAQVVNGFVVGATIIDGGCGYTNAPLVLVQGGGGSGATAAAILSQGVVTGIVVNNAGSGYTSVPTVRIASPPFTPEVGIEISRVNVKLKVVLGRKYQLQASKDLQAWAVTGPDFVAESESLTQEFVVEEVGRYFRVLEVP
jgi:N-acetylneuraminic acid mutarotase